MVLISLLRGRLICIVVIFIANANVFHKKKQQNGIRLYTLINLDILVEMTAKALKSLVILFFLLILTTKGTCALN